MGLIYKNLYCLMLVVVACSPPQERIEPKLMQCNYQSFQDGGAQLQQLMGDYENLLIKEGLLKDKSGASYRAMLSQISEENGLKGKEIYAFDEQFYGLSKKEDSKTQGCLQQVLLDSTHYDARKFLAFRKAMEKELHTAGDLRPEVLAIKMVELLSAKDLELNFYKFRVFFLLDMALAKNKLPKDLPPSLPPRETENTLEVYLDAENRVKVDGKEIEQKKLIPYLLASYHEHPTKTDLMIRTDSQTKYEDYIMLQNKLIRVINSVREKAAKKEYGKNYNALTEAQKALLDKEYPEPILSQ